MKLISLLLFVCALLLSAPVSKGQGSSRTGPDPSVIRDPDIERDSNHNLGVARQYFKLRKAYVASLQRCEEIIAGNPNFAKIDEVLFIAGESSLALAENKGRQKPSLYVTYDANGKRNLTSEEFREIGREYLTRLVNDHPNSQFRKQAEKSLSAVGGPKPEKETTVQPER